MRQRLFTISMLAGCYMLLAGCSQESSPLHGEFGTEAIYLSARYYKDHGRLPENVEEIKDYCRRKDIPIAFDSYGYLSFEKSEDGYTLYVDRDVSGQGIRTEIKLTHEDISELSEPDTIRKLEESLQ